MGVMFFDRGTRIANDGFDVTAQYQMVPVGGVRRMRLFVQADETEDCIVFVSNPNHAFVFGLFAIWASA